MKNIKSRVKNLVRKMGTSNPIQIATELKIPIEYTSLPDNIKGYLVRPLRRKIIVINDKLDEREVPVVVAHELGHVLMHETTRHPFHTDTVNYINARKEYEANIFALHLLSHSYIIDDKLVTAALLHMSSRKAHRILCRCLEWGMHAICYCMISIFDIADLLSLAF